MRPHLKGAAATTSDLESGREKMARILDLAIKVNAAVIALTIDEEGMAKTRQRKLEVARRVIPIG